jgi:ABC-type branched-subunit amino acid transport system ATPase component
MLTIRGVHASYGRKRKVLHAIDLEIGPDEMVCLIGANGAGKSTLLKTVCVPREASTVFLMREGPSASACTSRRQTRHERLGRKARS